MQTIYFNRVTTSGDLQIDSKRIDQLGKSGTSLDELHTTTFYELFLFSHVDGELMADGKTMPLNGPTAVLFPPLAVRQWNMTYHPDSYLVFFEAAFVEEFLSDTNFLYRLHYFACDRRVPVLPLTKEQHAGIAPNMMGIREELANRQADSVQLIRSYLMQLLLQFNRLYNQHHQLDPHVYISSEIIQFKSLLKAHIHDTQTVQAYAEMMGMSRNRMNELCVKIFGRQANQLIRDELLQACKTELLNSKLSLSEISYKYNFSAPSNFTRFFKSQTGMNPHSYREQFSA